MSNVTRVIAGLSVLFLLNACGKEPPKSKPDYSLLPQKVDIPRIGNVDYILANDLIDSVSAGTDLQLFFLQDYETPDPDLVIPIPGMTTIMIGEIINFSKKLDRRKPLYLVCLYGDDSKRMGKELAKEGWDVFYLDGGTYRLRQLMKQGTLKIPTRRG